MNNQYFFVCSVLNFKDFYLFINQSAKEHFFNVLWYDHATYLVDGPDMAAFCT